MTSVSVQQAGSGRVFRRIIGTYRGDRPGPSVVVVGGIHGNEAAGVLALERVFDTLRRRCPPFRGECVGLAGNLAALARGDRYVAEDLNRAWTPERVARIRRADPARLARVEDIEMHGLLAALESAFARARGPVYFLDLHTSSAAGPPFVLLGDTLRNRRFASKFAVPVLLGLEERIDGVLLEYVNALGHITLGFEAGRHDAPESIDRFEAALWIALIEAGNLDAGAPPEARSARRRLARALSPPADARSAPAEALNPPAEAPSARSRWKRRANRLPAVLEIRHRHGVEPGDAFTMRPGYRNFQSVTPGEVLATDARGPVRARCRGRILLPLYQGQGSDGFFIAREVRPFRLRVSAILRRVRADRLVPLLPGIRRHPDRPHALCVHGRLARRLALPLLHLLGFRRHRRAGDTLIVSRRRYDLRGP